MNYQDTPRARRVLVAYTQAVWDSLPPKRRRELAGQPGVAPLIIDGPSDIETSVSESVLAARSISLGDILVQNPYSTAQYFDFDDAAMDIALEKTVCVAHVCHLLGSRSFGVSSIENKTDGTSWNADAGGGAEGVVAKLTGGGGKSKKLARKINLNDTSSGGEPDVDRARNYLADHNLESDSMLKSLVDVVAVEGNTIQRRSLTIDVSREAKGSLKLAMDVNLANKGAGNTGAGRAREAIDQMSVTYEISF